MIHFDCHAHVYETTHSVPGARYAPNAPAPLSSWLKNLENHGLQGGVIVQVSFLGTDNSELVRALDKLDRKHFAGVAVVSLDVDDIELNHLVAAGVRGVRWNLVRGAEIPHLQTPRISAFFSKLRKRDLNLEVHLEGPRLAPHLARLSEQGIGLVIDHFGLPSDPNVDCDPLLKALDDLPDLSNVYIKLSARYRTDFDLKPHFEVLKKMLPADHLLWGSDWPHTQHEETINYAASYREASQLEGICDVDAAMKLYGISLK